MVFTENITARPIYKHPDDDGVYVADLTPWICNDDILSADSISSSDANLVADNLLLASNSQVQFRLAGGLDCVDYLVSIAVTLNDAAQSKITRVFPVRVRSH